MRPAARWGVVFQPEGGRKILRLEGGRVQRILAWLAVAAFCVAAVIGTALLSAHLKRRIEGAGSLAVPRTPAVIHGFFAVLGVSMVAVALAVGHDPGVLG